MPYAQCNKVTLGKTEVMLWCRAVMERWSKEGWVGAPPYFIAHTDACHTIIAPRHLFFPSLPGPAVGEMPSAARYAAVGVVGRLLPHVVRDAFCEGDGGIAEVREQHGYPPSASAVRECGGNCCGRSRSLTGDYADRDLDNPHEYTYPGCSVEGH